MLGWRSSSPRPTSASASTRSATPSASSSTDDGAARDDHPRPGNDSGPVLGHIETLERSAALVEQHAETLSGIPELADGLAELRSSLEDVRQLFMAEQERRR